MNIGIVNVDSKIPNLALMKISTYHKSQGDTVKPYDPLFDGPDLIYSCKVFDFTKDFQYYPADIPVVKGGTGYSITDKLPDEIENQCPDYELFDCGVYDKKGKKLGTYAMGFTTRGCSRECAFCIVPKKEGYIKAVADIYEFWQGQKLIRLLDNNLTALPEQFERTVKQLIKHKLKTDFSQGLDVRFMVPEMAQLLAKVSLWKQIHFAWDNMEDEAAVRRGVDILINNGVSVNKIMFYVLIGFNTTPEEDLYRVEVLRGLDVDPFVMPYNKRDEYQKRFTRWVAHKAIFKTVPWEKYAG